MQISIEVDLDYRLSAPGGVILMIEAAETEGQRILYSQLDLTPTREIRRVPADEGIGQRLLVGLEDRLHCRYRAEIAITRARPDLAHMESGPLEELSGEALRYLLPSRYCESDKLLNFVASRFEGLTGGALVTSLRDWVEAELSYEAGVSTGDTTATDTFLDRRGVCRDYAHLLIALCRAGHVPARFASVYAEAVDPPDFHAVAQVYLDGAWHLVDPTGMAEASAMALVAVGRDAADVAFLTTVSDAQLQNQQVVVRRLP